MFRLGFVLLSIIMMACGGSDGDKTGGNESGFNYQAFSESFKTASLPFILTDTGLLNNKDTASIKNAIFLSYLPDSIKTKIFGKSTVKLTPIAKVTKKDAESYLIVKAHTAQKQAALLFVFDKDKNFGTVIPFLTPDDDATTTQTSSVDNSLSVTKNVTRRNKEGETTEGKEVLAYNNDAKSFILVMTDLLDPNPELINPIDTLAKTHKFSGDYAKDKKNIVSVRDGRNENEVVVFVHIEKNDGECVGEIKGTALVTSSKTAVYRQGGDPCVLELEFKTNAVVLREVEGCGARRDLRCAFDGSFSRKKETKPKETGSTNKPVKN